MNKIEINKEKCNKCTMCIKDCVAGCIAQDTEGFPYLKREKNCINCQHCLAICPKGALILNDINPDEQESVSYQSVLSAIKSRKSTRQFKDENISYEDFSKLKSMLKYVPTGKNHNSLHFAFVEDKDAMTKIRENVIAFIVNMMNSKFISPLLGDLKIYKKALERGNDIIFRNAPHMVVVSSKITAPCTNIDPIIALSYLELYANSLSIGTCWCGYGQVAMKLLPELSQQLNIPDGYKPSYVMLLGYPKVKYQRITKPQEFKISSTFEITQKKQGIFNSIKRVVTNFIK